MRTNIHATPPILLLLLLSFSPPPAWAQIEDSQASPIEAQSGQAGAPWKTLIGWEGGKYFSFPYAIVKVPLWGNLDNGLGLKVAGDGLQYKFGSAVGTVHATAPSAETLLGYAVTSDKSSFSLYLGPQYRHTEYDQGFKSRFPDFGFKTDFSAAANPSDKVHMSFSAFYTTVNKMYRVQARPLMYGNRTGIQVGPEIIYLGNPDFNRDEYGLAATVPLSRAVSMSIHAGYMHHEAVRSGTEVEGAYYGISFTFTLGK